MSKLKFSRLVTVAGLLFVATMGAQAAIVITEAAPWGQRQRALRH
jgi:hypothetical protein